MDQSIRRLTPREEERVVQEQNRQERTIGLMVKLAEDRKMFKAELNSPGKLRTQLSKFPKPN